MDHKRDKSCFGFFGSVSRVASTDLPVVARMSCLHTRHTACVAFVTFQCILGRDPTGAPARFCLHGLNSTEHHFSQTIDASKKRDVSLCQWAVCSRHENKMSTYVPQSGKENFCYTNRRHKNSSHSAKFQTICEIWSINHNVVALCTEGLCELPAKICAKLPTSCGEIAEW